MAECRRPKQRCPKDYETVLRAAPKGVIAPMGQQQHTSSAKSSQKASRFPPRPCLRKGCERTFVPGHWNQRYCREPDCLRELHRWQAAKRQRRHRSHPENRRQHAEAERCRRKRQRQQRRVAPAQSSPSFPRFRPGPEFHAAARGHAVPTFFRIFAIAPVATSRCVPPAVLRPAIAATRAAKPWIAYVAESASTNGAEGATANAWPADENGRAGQDRRQTAGLRGGRPTSLHVARPPENCPGLWPFSGSEDTFPRNPSGDA